MIKSVDITIHQDWNKVRDLYNSVLAMKDANKLTNKHAVTEWYSTQYDIGNYGSLIYDHEDALSKDWGVLNGKILHPQLSWYNQARELFANLNFHGCAWSVSNTNIRLHCDGKTESEKDQLFCNLNYIISSDDPTGSTISYDSDTVSSYPSVPNTAWLLDPGLPHEVKCNGHREILQFKFFNSYDNVANFLDAYGPITVG